MTASLTTPFTDLVGITAPVVQAPISDLVRPPLVAAVSNAGGLGVHPFSWSEPATLDGIIAETRALTAKPFAVNLTLYLDQDERLGVCLDAGVALVSFFWGDSSPLVGRVHAAGAKAMQTVASADEAKRAVDAGVDIIVAQGWEAGGHVWGEVGGMALIPAVVDAVGATPVIAAGVWMGTRFVATLEAHAHENYKNKIIEANEDSTIVTRSYSGKPLRVIQNEWTRDWESRPQDILAFPHQFKNSADVYVIARRDGNTDLGSMPCGQGAGCIDSLLPAAEVVERVVAEASEIVARGFG